MLQTLLSKCKHKVFAQAGVTILSAESKTVMTTKLEQTAALHCSIRTGDQMSDARSGTLIQKTSQISLVAHLITKIVRCVAQGKPPQTPCIRRAVTSKLL